MDGSNPTVIDLESAAIVVNAILLLLIALAIVFARRIDRLAERWKRSGRPFRFYPPADGAGVPAMR